MCSVKTYGELILILQFLTVMDTSFLDTCSFQFSPFLGTESRRKVVGSFGDPLVEGVILECGGDHLTSPMWLELLVR